MTPAAPREGHQSNLSACRLLESIEELDARFLETARGINAAFDVREEGTFLVNPDGDRHSRSPVRRGLLDGLRKRVQRAQRRISLCAVS